MSTTIELKFTRLLAFYSTQSAKFKVMEQMKNIVDNVGKAITCGSCMEIRQSASSEVCPLSAMNDLYLLIKENEKIMSA